MTHSPVTDPDSEQLRALQDGDPAALRELIAAHHGGMLAVARAIVGEAFAEEVVQEAWLSIYKALPDFQQRSSLKTWMYKIVANGAKTRLRRENRQVSLDALEETGASSYLDGDRFTGGGFWKTPPPAWGSEAPETLLEETDLRRCIEATLERLPPQQKAVFVLRDIEQQELAGICNILQASNSNVRVLLHRARIKLMEIIDHYQETGEC
jgi:RNA polymerase sigma-70 factor (ECF subfamily)